MAKLTLEFVCSRLCSLCRQKFKADTPGAYEGKSGKGIHSERLLARDRMQTRNMALDDTKQTKQEEIKL